MPNPRFAEDAAAFHDILDHTDEAIAAGVPIGDHDHEFHMAIYRATQNDIFLRHQRRGEDAP